MKPSLNKEDFYAQFPNNENHLMAAEGYERPDWHTLMDGVPEEHTRKPVSYKRGGSVRRHPAHGIPGVHIVTAEAGEPVFSGRL